MAPIALDVLQDLEDCRKRLECHKTTPPQYSKQCGAERNLCLSIIRSLSRMDARQLTKSKLAEFHKEHAEADREYNRVLSASYAEFLRIKHAAWCEFHRTCIKAFVRLAREEYRDVRIRPNRA